MKKILKSPFILIGSLNFILAIFDAFVLLKFGKFSFLVTPFVWLFGSIGLLVFRVARELAK